MPNNIIRFGGSSLYNKLALKTFLKLVGEAEFNLTIVISAIPGIEAILEEGIDLLAANIVTVEKITRQVRNSVLTTEIGKCFSEEKRVPENELIELVKLLKGIQLTGDYSPALKDQVISYSEKITALVILSFLKENGINVVIRYPEDIGLVVSEEYGNASVLTERPLKVLSESENKHILIPASYGVTVEGRIARLGKHSADYAAAAITRLFQAEALELWELDHEFRTGDKQLIEESEIIPKLTYEEASELSYFSDKSVHPRIVEPLIANHVPIRIFRLTKKGKELTTIINSESYITKNVVKSVVHADDIAILKLNGPGIGFKPGILSKVTSSFHSVGINIRSVITSQVSINIILNKKDITVAFDICKQLRLNSVNDFIIADNVSLIAIIGQGMQQNHGISAKLFTAVAQHRINVLLSGSGASDIASYLIVAEKDIKKAVREIHRTFFDNQD